jgi:hypothetical protein
MRYLRREHTNNEYELSKQFKGELIDIIKSSYELPGSSFDLLADDEKNNYNNSIFKNKISEKIAALVDRHLDKRGLKEYAPSLVNECEVDANKVLLTQTLTEEIVSVICKKIIDTPKSEYMLVGAHQLVRFLATHLIALGAFTGVVALKRRYYDEDYFKIPAITDDSQAVQNPCRYDIYCSTKLSGYQLFGCSAAFLWFGFGIVGAQYYFYGTEKDRVEKTFKDVIDGVEELFRDFVGKISPDKGIER